MQYESAIDYIDKRLADIKVMGGALLEKEVEALKLRREQEILKFRNLKRRLEAQAKDVMDETLEL